LKYVHGSTMITVTTTAMNPCMIEAQMNLEAHLPLLCSNLLAVEHFDGYLSKLGME